MYPALKFEIKKKKLLWKYLFFLNTQVNTLKKLYVRNIPLSEGDMKKFITI